MPARLVAKVNECLDSYQQEIRSWTMGRESPWPASLCHPICILSGRPRGGCRLGHLCIFHSGLTSCQVRLDTRLPLTELESGGCPWEDPQAGSKIQLQGIFSNDFFYKFHSISSTPQAGSRPCSLRLAEWSIAWGHHCPLTESV